MVSESRAAARQVLIDTAERLIAERGFHGVSAREVVKESGHRNNSAITYHFGSWDKLLDAIWAHHAQPVNAERAELLSAVDRDDLRALVAIYVRPLVGEVARHSPSHWARYNEQWLASTPFDIPIVAVDGRLSSIHDPDLPDLHILGKLLQDIGIHAHGPAATQHRRVSMMCRFVIVALASAERDAAMRADGQPDADHTWDDLADELVTMATALLTA